MGWQHISTLFDVFSSTEKRVESNVCLAVKSKNTKITYADAERINDVVEAQDRTIANGGDPIDDLMRVDIQKE